MKVLIANQEQVSALMPMDECIGVMEDALRMLAEGDVMLPLRTMMILPDGQNLMGLMPSYLGGNRWAPLRQRLTASAECA